MPHGLQIAWEIASSWSTGDRLAFAQKLIAESDWVLVPKEPSWPMLAAGRDADRACEIETARRREEENKLTLRTENVGKVYSAMIGAVA